MVKDGIIDSLKRGYVLYDTDEFLYAYGAFPLLVGGMLLCLFTLWGTAFVLLKFSAVYSIMFIALGFSALWFMLFIFGTLFVFKFIAYRLDDQLKAIRFKLGIEGPVIAKDIIEQYKKESDAYFEKKG